MRIIVPLSIAIVVTSTAHADECSGDAVVINNSVTSPAAWLGDAGATQTAPASCGVREAVRGHFRGLIDFVGGGMRGIAARCTTVRNDGELALFHDLPMIPAPGGTSNYRGCTGGRIAVGMRASWSGGRIRATQLHCATPCDWTAGQPADELTAGVGNVDAMCPLGYALVGMQINYESGAGLSYVTGLQGQCAAIERHALGDLNRDGIQGASDIDLQATLLGSNSDDNLTTFLADHDHNGTVDSADRDILFDAIGTEIGDANLDGCFRTDDLVQVFIAGEYEDGISLNSGWATGDWSGDRDFTSADLVLAFISGGVDTCD